MQEELTNPKVYCSAESEPVAVRGPGDEGTAANEAKPARRASSKPTKVSAGKATVTSKSPHGRDDTPVGSVAEDLGETDTQVANREANVDRDRALKEGAREWQNLKTKADKARGAEHKAQAQEDQARWQQARLAADLHGRWGKDGLTFKGIAVQFSEPVSTIKLFAGTQREFADRTDLNRRRFSDWQKIHTAIRSEMNRIKRIAPDEGSLEKLTAAVEEKLPGVIDGVVADEKLKTIRDLGQKTKGLLRQLVHSLHTRLFPAPRPTGDPLRLTDGVDLLADQDDGSVSLLLLDAPYGTHANPRGMQMASNTPEEARDLLRRIAPTISRKLTDNAFVFWFRLGFRIDGTDDLKPILSEHFSIRQLVWFKTKAGLSAEGNNIGSCHELMYLLWPKGRSQPVPHVYIPDCLYVPHDGMSGANSLHPSAKPVALFQKLIEATTMPGDLVLDPFAGTGAAVEAALKLERRIVAAEIVPEIFALAQQRLTECRVDLANDPVTAAFAADRGIETL